MIVYSNRSESELNYRTGYAVGYDHAQEFPESNLGDAIDRHMAEIREFISFGPYEHEYRIGYATGWFEGRVR